MQNIREPGGAATRSTVRERAIEIGLAILDEEGADALTLKRIAEVVGVRPPALHWHFHDRHALMDEILKTALGRVTCEDTGLPWSEQLVAAAAAVFAQMPPVVAVAGALGAGPTATWPGMPRVSEWFTRILRRSELDRQTQADVHDAVMSIVVGYGLVAVGRSRPADRAIVADQVVTAVEMVLAGANSRLPAAH